MIRKFNYTNRQKIPRENIDITIKEIGDKHFFTANIKKEGLNFPDDAKIYIEPFYGPDFLRFDFGKFSNIRQPENTDVSELKQLSERIYFHIKVVDESYENGLLLGDAKIYDLSDDKNLKGKSSILYVNPIKMDTMEIWRLNFNDSEGMPVLEVNQDINGILEVAKTDSIFISLVYPSAIRQILQHIAFDLKDFDDEGESWNCKWIVFTKNILNVYTTPTDNTDEEACNEWVDSVVKAFCIKHKIFENYLNKINA